MPDKVEFNLFGIESLSNKLKAITYDVKRKGGRSSLRRAANYIAKKAKAKAKSFDDPGTARSIVDNIGVRWNGKLFKRKGDLGFRIGVAGGSLLKNAGDLSAKAPTPHWRLIEFGSSNMKARPFMRPAGAENTGQATAVFLSAYEKAIDKAIKKAKKGKKDKPPTRNK